jgi:hypothetical protein
MDDSRRNSDGISRRVVLTGSVIALGVAATTAAVTQAAAQAKASQKDAQYQDKPKDGHQCDGCIQFQPPNACKVIEGNISPAGWCALFTAK